jgi:hypothetical protein
MASWTVGALVIPIEKIFQLAQGIVNRNQLLHFTNLPNRKHLQGKGIKSTVGLLRVSISINEYKIRNVNSVSRLRDYLTISAETTLARNMCESTWHSQWVLPNPGTA